MVDYALSVDTVLQAIKAQADANLATIVAAVGTANSVSLPAPGDILVTRNRETVLTRPTILISHDGRVFRRNTSAFTTTYEIPLFIRAVLDPTVDGSEGDQIAQLYNRALIDLIDKHGSAAGLHFISGDVSEDVEVRPGRPSNKFQRDAVVRMGVQYRSDRSGC